MSRALTAGVISSLTASTVRTAHLFRGQFASTTIRLWTGSGDLTIGSETFLGNGWIIEAPVVSESEDIQADGASVKLSGVPTGMLEIALAEGKHGYTGSFWRAFFDASWSLIIDPVLMFTGFLDTVQIEESATSTEITLGYESKLRVLKIPREHRYTSENQRALFGDGDLGFDYMPTLANWLGYWGPPKKNG